MIRAIRVPFRFHTVRDAVLYSTGIEWLIVVVLLLFVLRVEKQPLGSLGLQMPKPSDFGRAFLLFVALIVYIVATHFDVGEPGVIVRRLAALPLGIKLMLVVTAAVAEEIWFRGYLLNRIGALAGNIWWGALASYAIFVLPHIGLYGLGWAVYGPVGAALLTLLYVWRRNLYACMFLHFLIDAPLLLANASRLR